MIAETIVYFEEINQCRYYKKLKKNGETVNELEDTLRNEVFFLSKNICSWPELLYSDMEKI